MHLDGNVLFGSSRSWDEELKSNEGDYGQVYLWKLDIDPVTGDFIGNGNAFCSKL